jgi:hypothetical protein
MSSLDGAEESRAGCVEMDALALAQPMVAPIKRNGGWLQRGGCSRRMGRCYRQARRAFIAADGVVTTADLVAAIYPHVKQLRPRHWYWARRVAERYGVRILHPRSNPLRWRARPL